MSAVADHQIRTHIRHKLLRQRVTGEGLPGVHKQLLTAGGQLHSAFSVRVVEIVADKPALAYGQQSVLLVPQQLAVAAKGLVAVAVESVGVADVGRIHPGRVGTVLFRGHLRQFEHVQAVVAVGVVVAGLQGTLELQVVLFQVEFLAGDVVHLVVGHVEVVLRRLLSCLEEAVCPNKPAPLVVAVVVGHLAADGFAVEGVLCGTTVNQAGDVVHHVVLVGIVDDGALVCRRSD